MIKRDELTNAKSTDASGPNGLIRKRDIAALVLALTALALSLEVNSSYTIQPTWFVDLRASIQQHVIRPVVADLDGDGLNEIICVSGDLKLQVLAVHDHAQGSKRMQEPEASKSTALLSSTNIAKGRSPVALSVGFLDSYDISVARKQYIAVLREDWTLVLFDHKLEKIWEKSLGHTHDEFSPFVKEYTFSEIDILLSSSVLQEGDHGLVIVGASMVRANKDKRNFGVHMEEGLDGLRGEDEHPDMDARWKLEHFSVYALDGGTGNVRWRHEGADMTTALYHEILPQHMYKLDTRNAHESQAWTAFRASLVQSLPHSWHYAEDTKMMLQHYQKRHIGGTKSKRSSLNKQSRPEPYSTPRQNVESGPVSNSIRHLFSSRVPITATLPHTHSEHILPNVVVIKGKLGIEVLTLRQGLPVTSLALPAEFTYADINGDSIIDTIKVVEVQQQSHFIHKHFFTKNNAHETSTVHAGNPDRLTPCTLAVLSGLPPRAPLFNSSVCTDRRSLDEPMSRSRARLGTDPVSAAPVVLLRSSYTPVRDIVTAVHTGVTMAHTGQGEFKWLLRQTPTWDLDFRAHSAVYSENGKAFQDSGTHDVEGAHALIQGQHNLALISSDGTLLAEASLPHTPIQTPILADFDNDGTNDIIVICREVLWGMKVRVSPAPQALFVMCCFFLLVIIGAFISSMQTVTIDVTPAIPRPKASISSEMHLTPPLAALGSPPTFTPSSGSGRSSYVNSSLSHTTQSPAIDRTSSITSSALGSVSAPRRRIVYNIKRSTDS